jgi:hypothetical protein
VRERPRPKADRRRRSPALVRSPRLGSLQRMPIKFENVGIAVRDLEAAVPAA